MTIKWLLGNGKCFSKGLLSTIETFCLPKSKYLQLKRKAECSTYLSEDPLQIPFLGIHKYTPTSTKEYVTTHIRIL